MADFFVLNNGDKTPSVSYSTSLRNEKLVVTAPDTITNLTNTPVDSNGVVLSVNGIVQNNDEDYTIVGKAITWAPGTAGFNLEVSDYVRAVYHSTD